MTQLTAHFSLAELTKTSTGMDNTPTPSALVNLQRLAVTLEVIRAAIGRPVRVHSGYRNAAVNKAVGGVPTSDHAKGYAADISVAGIKPRDLAKSVVVALAAVPPQPGEAGPYDQVILETSRGVVHVSIAPRRRMQQLTQAGGAGTPVTTGFA